MRARSMWCVVVAGSQLAAPGLTLGAPVKSRPTTPKGAVAAPDGAGLARAQRQIAEREYHASRNVRGLQAPNRTHNLRAYFEPDGVRLHDRTAAGEPELMALRLAGLGRAGVEQPVPVGEVVSHGAHVEIRRPGVVEWYVNGSAGLEHGFTLAERPAGDGELSLKLALSSGTARSAGLDAALLKASHGRTLRYDGLVVLDSHGRSVPAQLRVTTPNELHIQVDDARAVYPLTVDPMLTDAFLQSNQEHAQLGTSVAGAGDVNLDGYDDVLVGAPGYDVGEVAGGAAFVFLGGPTGIADGGPATASAMLASGDGGAKLGWSVAGAGDVNDDGYADVIVGAPVMSNDAPQASEGAAKVFLGGPAGIQSATVNLLSSALRSHQADSSFGYSVAGLGDVNGDNYDDVIVGAHHYDSPGQDEGVAFVFLGGPNGIGNGSPATADTTLQVDQPGALLGTSVAGAGDVDGDGYADVIVGAPYYESTRVSPVRPEEGAAFVFKGGPLGVQNLPATELRSEQQEGLMGVSVASAGDVNADTYADVIVGASGYDFTRRANEGAAFVFLGGPAGVASGGPAHASATLRAKQAGARMGGSVAGAGDVNGDHYDDVIVGARDYDGGDANEGVALVFLGGATGVKSGDPASSYANLQPNQPGAAMGRSVAGAGDVNGDEHADVIVGAYLYDGGQTNEGAAFVFLGSYDPDGLTFN